MMTESTQTRYQIVREVGSGSFATVYAARDLKLGRDVAIKQILQQFLSDRTTLARYWQEAQLLASLEHPHILTIYDVVESRGCLVLELMQGSLKQLYQGRPMALPDARQTLIQAAQGLHLLHTQGIIHGDIKPGNLLLSRQNLVKLGDFGLARRASDPDGSLLKGTTKYMAPEVVSDQFGPVGPASDLYSLGFTVLELICGSDFDLLFPGLAAFGRDQQMAWMLWHSAPDRRLPELRTILEGLPEDLAHVLQKLTVKDLSQRYRTAREVLADLGGSGVAMPVDHDQSDAKEANAVELARQKKRRWGAIAAFTASVVFSLAMLFYPLEKPQPAPPPPPPEPIQGVLQNVQLGEQKFVIAVGDDWKEIALFDHDRVMLNRRERQLRDLQPGDRVTVRTLRDAQQRPFQEIVASRPETHTGSLARIQADEGQFVLQVAEGEDADKEFVLQTTPATRISLNGDSQRAGQPLALENLNEGDQAVVQHAMGDAGPFAIALDVRRIVEHRGVVRDVNANRAELTFALGADQDAPLMTLPVAESAQITLNGLRFVEGKLLKAVDLQPGDRITVRRDVQIVGIDAYRAFRQQGAIRRIAYETGTLDIALQGDSASNLFVLSPDCKITLAGEAAQPTDLRVGDVVELTHDSPGDQSPTILTLQATRPPDLQKWALLLANQNFDDATLSPLPYALASAKQLRERLIARYAVPPAQAIRFDDESRIRLEQELPKVLASIPPEAELHIYLVTHAYVADDGKIYLATRDFTLARPAETGLDLAWLIDQLEACPAQQKTLLLDSCHSGDGADLRQQPSAAELMKLVLESRRVRALRTLHVLASCSAGQRGSPTPDDPTHSLFAECLVEGYSGAADTARDNLIEPTELGQFVERCASAMAALSAGEQTPRLFLADATPPRLTDEAKQAIRRLLTFLSQSKVDPLVARLESEKALRLAAGQPEPLLALGLVYLKARQRDEALRAFEQVRLEHDDVLLAHQAVAWINFEKREYAAAVAALQYFVERLPAPSSGAANPAALALFEWTGRLRELSASATWSVRAPAGQALELLDQAVARHGAAAGEKYAAGREHVRSLLANFEQQIQEDPSLEPRINLQKMNSNTYAAFPLESSAVHVRNRLEQ